MPEKKKTTVAKKTVRAAAAPGDVASGRGSRPRRPAARAGKAAASSETRLSSTSPGAAARKASATAKKARTAGTEARLPSTSGPAASGMARAHRGKRRTKVGRVISAKTPKTVIVEVERMREHPLYKKVIRVRKKYPAHDARGDVKAGDLVRIQESRPFSATKRWQVLDVISRAGEAFAAAPEAQDVEHRLEEVEGVTELLAKPVSEAPDAAAEAEGNEGDEA